MAVVLTNPLAEHIQELHAAYYRLALEVAGTLDQSDSETYLQDILRHLPEQAPWSLVGPQSGEEAQVVDPDDMPF